MPSARLLALPLLFVAAGLSAQGYPRAPQVQPLQTMPRPTPDADALADAMRTLGSNPRDLAALISAGELSLKLGDVNAAAALFKRAEDVDPMNGRVKAGMARILVSQERPGEALRYFDQAAGYGLDVRSFAGDRALAYDLIGEQERAQRDYRLALANGANDEVQRRYALSLGISGRMSEALAQIDPLLRESDRGAWRARAFILAMGGDVTGAGVIATRMMPPGMAAGLQPFFEKLATLPATDRAFAVHFGELRPTAQRLADRRLAPALPVLLPEAGSAPVALASAQPVKTPDAKPDRRRTRDGNRDRRRRDRDQPAAVAVASTPATPPLPQAPTYGGGVAFAPPREVAQTLPGGVSASVPSAAVTPATSTPSVRPPAATVVAANVVRAPSTVPASVPRVTTTIAPRPTPVPSPGFSTSLSPEPAQRPVATVTAPATVPKPVVAASVTPTPSSAPVPTTPRPAPQIALAPAPAPSPVVPAVVASTVPAAPATSAPPAIGLASNAPTAPRMSEDTILARIVAGITIPASELGVEPPRPTPATASETAPGTTVATAATVAAAENSRRAAEAHRQRLAAAATEPVAPADKPAAAKTARKSAAVAADEPAPTSKNASKINRKTGVAVAEAVDTGAPVTKAGTRKTGGKAAKVDEAAPLDPKAAAKKALADKKAADAKKLADAKKAEDKKKAADEAKAAKAEPARIWVQVAGGAYEGDLPKAWAAAKSKAPALAGKAAYSTPLRATNRVVTGPFKTDAEARAFVNTLAKQGISAFPFTSEKGQKMTRLPTK